MKLKKFDPREQNVDEEGVRALADLPHLKALEVLKISIERSSEDTIELFEKKFALES